MEYLPARVLEIYFPGEIMTMCNFFQWIIMIIILCFADKDPAIVTIESFGSKININIRYPGASQPHCSLIVDSAKLEFLCRKIRRDSLKCYECDNGQNPACGVDFKSYQYEAQLCTGNNVKCGLQRQSPFIDKSRGTFIGVIRLCYQLGSLQGINETNGCRFWTSPENFTALYCFCSTDYCNGTILETGFPVLLCVGLLLVLLVHLIQT